MEYFLLSKNKLREYLSQYTAVKKKTKNIQFELHIIFKMAPNFMYLVKFPSDLPGIGVHTGTLQLNFMPKNTHQNFNISNPK